METPAQVGFRNKIINPNQHHNQPKEIIVNRTYLRHTRGDEPEVVRAKIKNPEYKAPPDVNISQPKYIPQVRPYKSLSGTSAKLENLIAGQNKNPYTLLKMWNLGYLDDVNPNLFLGREYTLQLMKEAGVEEVKKEEEKNYEEYMVIGQTTPYEYSTKEDETEETYTSGSYVVMRDVPNIIELADYAQQTFTEAGVPTSTYSHPSASIYLQAQAKREAEKKQQPPTNVNFDI